MKLLASPKTKTDLSGAARNVIRTRSARAVGWVGGGEPIAPHSHPS